MIKEVIRKYNDRDSLYGNKLTNHLNMGLFALYKMGANKERLHQFATNYIHNNNIPELKLPIVLIDNTNFWDYVGIDGYYSSFIPFFEKELEEYSLEIVMKKYLNQFVYGFVGGAFHGVIRLAYSIELGDNHEIAKALAYLAECYKPLVDIDSINNTEYGDPYETIRSFSLNEYFIKKEFTRELIIGRITDVSEDEKFVQEAKMLNDEFLNFNSFNEIVLRLYAMTDNFTILHGYTSSHALRVLSPYLDNIKLVLKVHWYYLQMAYVSTNCIKIKSLDEIKPCLSWEDIFNKTILSDNVHIIKIVYSLYEQSKLYEHDDLARRICELKFL